MYHVIDIRTGADEGGFDTPDDAHTLADRLEQAIGYVRYVVRWLNF